MAALSPIVGSDMGWPISVPHLSWAVIQSGMEPYKCQGFSLIVLPPRLKLAFLNLPTSVDENSIIPVAQARNLGVILSF